MVKGTCWSSRLPYFAVLLIKNNAIELFNKINIFYQLNINNYYTELTADN